MDIRKNQSGQIIVESVLLIVLTLGILTFAFGKLKQMNFVQTLTTSPWARVSGMVECGSWNPCGLSGGSSGQKSHPNNRIVSFRPL